MHGSPCGNRDATSPKGNDMTSPEARKTVASAVDLSVAKAAMWLSLTAFLALVVLYCRLYGRVGNLSPRSLSLLLAGGMFLSLYLIPFLKYPPNPPATSIEETIRQRTLLYVLIVVLSAALLVAAVYLGHRLVAQL